MVGVRFGELRTDGPRNYGQMDRENYRCPGEKKGLGMENSPNGPYQNVDLGLNYNLEGSKPKNLSSRTLKIQLLWPNPEKTSFRA